MAVSSLGIGISINVRGNFEKKLKGFQTGMNKSTKATKNNTGANKKNTSQILKTAAAFGILGTAINRSAQFMFGINKVARDFFGGIISDGAQFQEAMLGIEVFFGDDSETLAGKILDIANASDVALTDVTNIARRLGALSLPIQQTADTTNILTQALSTLAGQDRTRALNGVSNIMTDMNSAAKLLNTSFSDLEKSAFKSAKGSAKQAVLLEALEKRFGRVNQVMKKGFLFGLRQVGQLFTVMKSQIALVFLENEALIKSIADFVGQINDLVKNGRKAGSVLNVLGKAFADALSPVVRFFQFMVKSRIVPRFLKFLSTKPALIKGFIRLALVGTLVAAVILKMTFLLFAFIGAVLLLESIVLPALAAAIPVAVGIGLALLAAVAIVFLWAGAFKSAFGPTIDFIMRIVSALKLIGITLFQAFSKGKIQTKLAEELRTRGLLPLFRILVTVGARIISLFKGIFDQTKTLGPVFSEMFTQLSAAFKEIVIVIQNLLISMGFMKKGGVEAFGSIGTIIGKSLVVGIKILIFAILALVRVFVFLFKFIIGINQLVRGLFLSILGFILQLSGTISKFLSKIPLLGKLLGFGGDFKLSLGKELSEKGGADLSSGVGNLGSAFSGSAETSDPNLKSQEDTPLNAPVVNNKIQVNVGGKDVAAVVEEQQDVQAAAGNAAP